MTRMGRGIKRLLQRFRRSQRGNVAMMAGIALPVLLMISAGAIDLHHIAKVRSELQDALDAATLAAARSNKSDSSEIQSIGMASLRANMPKYFADGSPDVARFKLNNSYEVEATAEVQVKTIVANVFLPPYGKLFDDYMPMSASSQVLRASRNVEVALALDVTGSMGPTAEKPLQDFMPALRDAANELVNIVIQGDQKEFTTKVALVPYAAGVNMGDQAVFMRGPLVGDKNIVAVGKSEAGKRISSVNNSNKYITLNNHGLKTGDTVYLTGFNKDSKINGQIRKVTLISNSQFTINGEVSTLATGRNANNNSDDSNRGTFYKCFTDSCEVVVTTKTDHMVIIGEQYSISGTSGINNLNNYYYPTRIIDNRKFVISNTNVNYGSSISSEGILRCGYDGCETRRFVNMNNNWRELPSTKCVSERVRQRNGAWDRPPSEGNYLGRAYLNNTCPSVPLLPLTNEQTEIESHIKLLSAGGSTAGHIGIENAWYAISPNFGPINGVTPLPFDAQKTIKAVVLMTDGMFNIPFCEGVIARNSIANGSGNATDKIKCDAPNGTAFEQAVETCAKMKAQGIVIYSVAFNLDGASARATEAMSACASTSETFFEAKTETDLRESFKQIGRDITRLRIAR